MNGQKTIDSGTDRYLVQTRSQAKTSGIKMSEVHGTNKGLIPHIKPEKSTITHQISPTCHLRPVHQIPLTDQGTAYKCSASITQTHNWTRQSWT